MQLTAFFFFVYLSFLFTFLCFRRQFLFLLLLCFFRFCWTRRVLHSLLAEKGSWHGHVPARLRVDWEELHHAEPISEKSSNKSLLPNHLNWARPKWEKKRSMEPNIELKLFLNCSKLLRLWPRKNAVDSGRSLAAIKSTALADTLGNHRLWRWNHHLLILLKWCELAVGNPARKTQTKHETCETAKSEHQNLMGPATNRKYHAWEVSIDLVNSDTDDRFLWQAPGEPPFIIVP